MPASFTALLLEVKARIVEMAVLQDEVYHSIRDSALGIILEEVKTKRDWDGKPLRALSETNKELNSLATKHVFRVMPFTNELDGRACS